MVSTETIVVKLVIDQSLGLASIFRIIVIMIIIIIIIIIITIIIIVIITKLK